MHLNFFISNNIFEKNFQKNNLNAKIGSIYKKDKIAYLYIGEIGASLFFNKIEPNSNLNDFDSIELGEETDAPNIYKCQKDSIESFICTIVSMIEIAKETIQEYQNNIENNWRDLSDNDVDNYIKRIDNLKKGINKLNIRKKQLFRGIINY